MFLFKLYDICKDTVELLCNNISEILHNHMGGEKTEILTSMGVYPRDTKKHIHIERKHE